jgi:nicotinate-nucleotide--dimethylbenzimidazole phosphoribosyltransferase
MSDRIDEVTAQIVPVGTDRLAEIQAHLDDLTKPPGSLGRLEELVSRYCLIRETTMPGVPRKRICCFAGDHGVAGEGVSAFPREVTPQMVLNMLAGGAAVNVLARHAGAELRVVDMGVADPLTAASPDLVRRKIADGTASIADGPAMSLEQAETAIMAGVNLACAAADDGVELLGTGEMGIANTTPATALFVAYLGCDTREMTGRGTGIDDERLTRKIDVINRALVVNRARLDSPLHTLAALGGYEIAGICGLILGAAARRIPVVVDGFISTAGALAASRLCPAAADYLFFSHCSEERGHRRALEEMNSRPLLDLAMRLGEGTGAALAMTLVDASIRIYNEMATFSSAGVSGEA